ncbi:RNA-binding KH domain-containing protein PEPPER-like [Aristolochia californica]|uniref:RNA-binding KH domain-containing protein PEPPER-like n=1 Tax=Aristolochia californica TaxID=171875 RepID=UPI0035D9F898
MATPSDSVLTQNGPSIVPESEPQLPSTDTTTAEAPVGDSGPTPSSSGPETVASPPPALATTPAPAPTTATRTTAEKKWPGWPGDSVFRLIVPVLKVGSIIGRKGELIKKMCEETRARIRILEGALGTADRVVLISGKEEPDAPISPAMEAVLRVFKRITGLSEGDGEATGVGKCSIRLLVASSQAIYLIGKQGSVIKSIQESSGASVRVLPENEVPFYASPDERIIDIQGDSSKVLKALEAVVGHLRKFLVDHSVLPLFEKTYNATISQDRAVDPWSEKSHTTSQGGYSNEYSLSLKRDSMFLEREAPLENPLPHSGLSLYGQDPAISGLRSSGLGRAIVTQITQTMQIPLSYAEDIIGVGGANIAYIRRTSGAILTVQETIGRGDEITVEIKGTSTQVQTAQQLIQDFIAGHKEPASSSYSMLDSGMRSYSQMPNSSYPSSSLTSQSLGGYGPPGIGGYSSYRM